MLELLSPAGSMDALRAAVQNGADAVYLGLNVFNARGARKNFTLEELREAVPYCHVRGVQVHLALNILVTDRELTEAAEVIRAAARIGVDAFIVQDLGLVELCRSIAPAIPVHASTQMSIHSLEGVLEAARLGVSRVVLAPGAAPGGNRLYLPQQPRGDRSLRPRRAVHVLFRPVLPLLGHRPPQRQTGASVPSPAGCPTASADSRRPATP